MAEKARTAAETALIAQAIALKAKPEVGIKDWNQEAHALFIASRAKAHGLPAASLESFIAELKTLGLGGNASQFAQAAGFRSAKAEITADAIAAL